ncbi:hypothetical protein AJ80_10078, partial [Polytolypa hystricis UAMH7299]
MEHLSPDYQNLHWEECERQQESGNPQESSKNCNYHWKKKNQDITDLGYLQHYKFPTFTCNCKWHEKMQDEKIQQIRNDPTHYYYRLYGCDVKDCRQCNKVEAWKDAQEALEWPSSQDKTN